MFLDSVDTVERLYSLLPKGWFPDLADAPNLNGVLSMLGAAYSNDEDGVYQFLQYAQQQTRIFTATGFWLDLAAQDYFGAMIQRHTNESDTSFRRRIILNLLAPRGTRPALMANVANLTGIEPKIIELRNPGDCGSYTSAANPSWGGCAYNVVGAYGTMIMPYQLLINVTRPAGEGIPNVGGYSMPGWAYATVPQPFGYVGGNRPPANTYGNGEYVQLSDIVGQVTDSDIYWTIANTMPAGTTAWTAISSPLVESPPTGGGAILNTNFYLDLSVVAEATLPELGLFAAGMMFILAHGRMQEQEAFLGMLKFPKFQVANAIISEAPPLTWHGLWTMPLIKAMGSMIGLPSKLTISIVMPEVIIYTTTTQMRLPITLPFVLGSIPNAQPLLGISFVLGTNAPGEMGGVALTSAISTCQVGSMVPSIPPSLSSVSTGGVASGLAVGGVNLSESNSLTAATTVGNAGLLGFQPQLLLPITMPFLLGSTAGTGTSDTFGISGASSTCAAGIIRFQTMLTGVSTACVVGNITETSSHVAQSFSASRKTSTVVLSNNNLTATQTAGSDDAVYGINSNTSGKFYWEVTTTYESLYSARNLSASAATASTANLTWSSAGDLFAGIGNLSAAATAGAYVGSSLNSLGWDATDGSIQVNGTSIGSWIPWTSTANPTAPGSVTNTAQTSSSLSYSWSAASDVVTICFALDATNGLIWGRIANGNWYGSVTTSTGILIVGTTPLGSSDGGNANPATGSGGLAIPSSVLASALAPGCTVNTAGDTVTANFASASWVYAAPTGFGTW